MLAATVLAIFLIPAMFAFVERPQRAAAAAIRDTAGRREEPRRWRRALAASSSLSALVVLGSGCRVGPRYARPARRRAGRVSRRTRRLGAAASLGEAKWWEVFRDEELQKLIARALTENYDVRIAAARILQARAQLTITRADQFPTVTAEATATGERTPATPRGGFAIPASTDESSIASTRRCPGSSTSGASSAAPPKRSGPTLLGTQWAARAVLVSVVDLVAQSYFTLRELDLELEIARRTLAAREESLRLTRVQEAGGIVSMLDVRRPSSSYYTAASVITDTERLITQQENALSILLGQNPGPIPRGRPLVDQPEPPEVPAGLPSSLLERRPDIRQAEQTLIAATARIGVAKAALVPGDHAHGERADSRATRSPHCFPDRPRSGASSGGLVQQIFNAGRLKANVRLTEAQQLEFVYTYQQAVQQAFREVSDALVGYQKTRELRRS